MFLGLAVGFFGCCIGGRLAVRQQPLRDFVRFHPGLSPDSHYSPTFSQTLKLARQYVKPGKVLVIVGGNSVLHGVGQRPGHVWTKALQARLGDDYVVLNLAMRGQWSNEFGGLVAERLAADGVQVVYVTLGTESDVWGCDWDGGTYPYFFWDAYGKGLVPPDPRRDEWLADGFFTRHGKDEAALERRRRGAVDGATHAQDLWNLVAHRYRGTLWTPLKYPKFWEPHRVLTDTDPGDTFPHADRFQEAHVPRETSILRGRFESAAGQKLLRGEGYDAVGAEFGRYLPDVMRDRTLYVLRMEATFFRRRLTDEQQRQYVEVSHRYRDAVRAAGLNVELVGERYVDEDYADRSHISEQGGRRLAVDLAPAIRAMSAKLYGPKYAAPPADAR